MAILSDSDRAAVWADLMRQWSAQGLSVTCLKGDIRAAVNALDQWLEDNATTINQAIPQPARTALTIQQKALLLQYVAAKRYLVT